MQTAHRRAKADRQTGSIAPTKNAPIEANEHLSQFPSGLCASIKPLRRRPKGRIDGP
jgi:hypothetical protein